MFGPFASVERKTRQAAEQWLELADKVYHFRRDVLAESAVAELRSQSQRLREQVKAKANAADLKLGIESLEGVLRKVGGSLYPKSGVVDNLEFFLVAAIVILGIRAYIVQPFKIPTNSMWPTFYGMTPQVYESRADEPGVAGEAFNFITQLAKPYRIDAPADGKVAIDVAAGMGSWAPFSRPVRGRDWLVLPATKQEITFSVNDIEVPVRVPQDFRNEIGKLIVDRFGSQVREALSHFDPAHPEQSDSRLLGRYSDADGRQINVYRLTLDMPVHKGDRILSFDLLTGDQLFVDRVSYHFVPPSVGDGFVFRTGHIPELVANDGDKFYIKRLVGLPGDTLEIKDHTLYRNGEPITGAASFEKESKQEDSYPGYQAVKSLSPGEKVTVSKDGFFAMGDNSDNSYDSRYWGEVPLHDAVGRPLFIYYPFTKRWGRTH